MRMTRGGQSVWDYLADVQGRAYEQEARLYEAMQQRLESALEVNGFTRDGVYPDTPFAMPPNVRAKQGSWEPS